MPSSIGQLGQLWRYPVKSMQGERLKQSALGHLGIVGDRAWAVHDDQRGGIRGAKKIPALMRCAARYREEPGGSGRSVEITLPDGSRVATGSPDASRSLSAALDHPVTLCALRPADDLDHYRRGAPDHEDFEQELRAIFGRLEDEPLPDLAQLPPELMEFESPPGTYFDAFPLLVMTTSSLHALEEHCPDSKVDVRRFRPNILIESRANGSGGFLEQEWVGKRLQVGQCEIRIETPCPRCVMVTHPFEDLPKDPLVLRSIVREADQNFGVYATVTRPGVVRVGDPVELLDE